MKNAELWKRILHNGITVKSPDWTDEIRQQHIEAIIPSPIIVDSRPRDEDEERGRPWRWEMYRGVETPFNRFWLEGTAFGVEGFRHWGVLFESGANGSLLRASDGGRLFKAYAYMSGNQEMNGLVVFFGWMLLNLDARSMFGMENHRYGWVPEVVAKLDPENRSMHTLIDSALETLFTLSCKNVSLASRENDPKQVRIATKRHGLNESNYRYHVLVVRPPGARSDHPGEEIGNMPRHVCRGHFKEYTADRPMFGRAGLFGRFFVPPHMRGDKKNGIVEKDYEVRATA